MKLTLEIDESIWQYALDKFNSAESAKATQAQEQHAAVMSHTPEKLRTNPPPDFVPLTLEQCVIKAIEDKEGSIVASRTADHITTIQQQSPETIARFAKAATLPEKVKGMLAAQVDAL